MSSAIVIGATGILGREIAHRLGGNAQRWKKVHAISRSKKEDFPANVQHLLVDLFASPADIAKALDGVQAEFLFFAAYFQRDSEQENWDVNGDMLENLLEALKIAGVAKTLKRIVLVTGAKQYGVHLGPPKNPMEETDAWLRDECFPPNFYYRQQDILKSFCEEQGSVEWVVTYPNDVIGFAKGNFMNLATSVGLYAAVCKELGEDLVFPGSETFYTRFDSFTAAKLHAEFCEWAALEPRAGNQAFNVTNGDVQSWQMLWPLLARYFGVKVKADQFAGRSELSSESVLCDTPPLSLYEDEAGLKGKVEPGKMQQRVDLVKWSGQDKVRRAWDRLAGREGLQKDSFDSASWAFLGLVLGRNYDIVISMSKARSLGWTGYCDSWNSLQDVFRKLEQERILPKSH